MLDDVSVDFEMGKLHLIIGPNGAGKSTLIKAICNQIIPTEGFVYYGASKVSSIPPKQLAKVRAVLSQNIELAFSLSASEVVMMGRYPHFNTIPTDKDIAACDAAMQFFDVQELANRNYLTLSGGEKQRVQFARVLSQIWYATDGSCRYLILDEPLAYLDVYYQFQLMQKIKDLAIQENIVVIGVIHDLNLAVKFADQITLLHNGRVLANGSAEAVINPENIHEVYKLRPVIVKKEGHLNLFFE